MELGWFLKDSKGKSTDEKVDDLTELVVKVLETFVSVMGQIDDRIQLLEGTVSQIQQDIKIDNARQEGEMSAIRTLVTMGGRVVAPAIGEDGVPAMPGVPAVPSAATNAAPPPPKPKPQPKPLPAKPMSGMGARAALQGELKALFSKMKKEKWIIPHPSKLYLCYFSSNS